MRGAPFGLSGVCPARCLGWKRIGLIHLSSLDTISRATSPMDTIDRPDSNVPARFPADSSRLPAPIPAIARDLAIASTPPSKVSPQVILRGLSRHWWRILLISMAVYAPLAYGIWMIVEPTYEAFSVL